MEYKIQKNNLKKIKIEFLEFFPKVLKDKDQEKLIKEYLDFPYIWQLGRISTTKKYLGKGIASNLLKEISNFITLKKGKKILVYVSEENKIAQKFYIKNKFTKEAKIEKMKLGIKPLFIFTKEL
jgi:GNAT superfamily N-acetyltransferase